MGNRSSNHNGKMFLKTEKLEKDEEVFPHTWIAPISYAKSGKEVD